MKKLSKEALLKKMKKLGIEGALISYAQTMMTIEEIEKLVVSRENFLQKKMVEDKIPKGKAKLEFEDFKVFPKDVQKKVISVLSAYDECNISFEYGHWDITPDSCIRSSYGKDHRVFGTFYYDELVNKVKGLKEAREKYLDDFSKINVPDSFWA